MSERKIVLKNVRIRYPQLAVAKESRLSTNGRKYFSAQLVIAENDEANRKAVIAGMTAAFNEKFGDKATSVMEKAKQNQNTRGLQHDLDLGAYRLNAKRIEENGAPVVFARDLSKITIPSEYPQGGDYVDAVVQAWCYDSNGSKGVSFELVSVRFREKGEPFPGGGLKATADDFEALDDKPSANDNEFQTSAWL